MNHRSIGARCGAICALFLMAGWPLGAKAQTVYAYSIEAVPPPSGASVAVVMSARLGGAAVTATVRAFNAAGVVGDDPRTLTIPGNGFVRLNNADLALGHETGARKIKIRADGALDVSAMRIMWGEHAVSLPVHERIIVPETYGTVRYGWTRDQGELGIYWGVALNQPSRSLASQRAVGACPDSRNGRCGVSSSPLAAGRDNAWQGISGSECIAVAVAKDGGGSLSSARYLVVGEIGASYNRTVWEAGDACYITARTEGFRNTPGVADGGCNVLPELVFCNEPGGAPFTTGGYYSLDRHFAERAASRHFGAAMMEDTQAEE